MFEMLGISPQALFGQLLIGPINGSFYALLSLGLAVIFGMLNIINFAHGAQYMLAPLAFFCWNMPGSATGGLISFSSARRHHGRIIERLFLQWLYKLDHLYGLPLTSAALIIEGTPEAFGFFRPAHPRLPSCRGQNLDLFCRTTALGRHILACGRPNQLVIERTKLGALAGIENRRWCAVGITCCDDHADPWFHVAPRLRRHGGADLQVALGKWV
jgi:branched-chain amino acid transport system permease protein